MLPTTTTRDLLADITTIQHNEKDIICFLYKCCKQIYDLLPHHHSERLFNKSFCSDFLHWLFGMSPPTN